MEAIEKGEKECWEMPHAETLRIMKQMDALRAQWGVVYPFERADGNPEEQEREEIEEETLEEGIELLTGEVEEAIPEDTDI